ncbi:MAG: hypothetical protein OXG34_15025 [bacterium]|nr:hypothetical protein [bacterium]
MKNLYVVDFGSGPLYWTLEKIDEYGGNLSYGNPTWTQVSSNPVCYKPGPAKVLDLGKIIVDGVTYFYEGGKAVIKKASHLTGQAKNLVEKAAREYAERLYRQARSTFDILCSGPGQAVSSAAAGYALAQTAIATSATAALAASGATVLVAGAPVIVAISASAIAGTAIWAGCKYVIDNLLPDSGSGTSDSNSDITTPTATPTPAPTATPTSHPVCGVAPSNGVIQGYPSYNRSRCGPTQWKEAADSSECTAVGRWKAADGQVLYICPRGWYARWRASNR